jgi:hypothetical protein
LTSRGRRAVSIEKVSIDEAAIEDAFNKKETTSCSPHKQQAGRIPQTEMTLRSDSRRQRGASEIAVTSRNVDASPCTRPTSAARGQRKWRRLMSPKTCFRDISRRDRSQRRVASHDEGVEGTASRRNRKSEQRVIGKYQRSEHSQLETRNSKLATRNSQPPHFT